MKTNKYILFLGALFFPNFASAYSLGEFISCNAMTPQPAITMKYSYGKLIHDLSQSPQFVANLGKNSPVLKENGLLSSGIAYSQANTNIAIKQVILKRLDDNYSCLMPEEIEVFVGYKDPVVYVSNKYDKQSCEFSQIIRHEQVHQRINKLTLDYFLPLIDKAIRNAILEVKAVKVMTNNRNDIDQGYKDLFTFYRSRLDPILDEFFKARDNEQKKLDNINSYQHDWSICKRYKEKVAIDEKVKKLEAEMAAENN